MTKRLFSIILSVITVITAVLCVPVCSAFASTPVVSYNFDNSSQLPELFGDASVVTDSVKGKVLNLTGNDGCYAKIPTDSFSDKMTISMDVKSLSDTGNFFTFVYGVEDLVNNSPQMYSFLRVRGTNIRNAITINGNLNEKEVFSNFRKVGEWQNVTIVYDDTSMTMYINGVLETHYQYNANTGVKTSDMGDNLVSYLGKSLFKDDLYFKGMIDNFKIFDTALTKEQVVESISATSYITDYVTIGTLNEDYGIQYDWEYTLSGTDDHTAVTSNVDHQNNEITSYIRFNTPLNAVPVTFNSAFIDNATITVDGQPFVNGSELDLNYDRQIEVTLNGRTESYTLRVPVYAYNPVLPGQYADPDIDYFDGKYWIYPTTDGYYWWSGSLCHAFSSEDLINWKDEGVVLDVNSASLDKENYVNEFGVEIAVSPWSNGSAWAPTVEKKNDKYYLYYCGRVTQDYADKYGADINGNAMMAIGVAVADNPAGPFTCVDDPVCYQNLYKEQIPTYTGEQIDPAIFTDDDGKSYIVSGGSCVAFIAELTDDMTSVVPDTIKMIHRPNDSDGKNGIDFMEDFLESFYIFKRNGYYYFTWSCYGTNGEDYTVKYIKIKENSKYTLYQLIDKTINGSSTLRKATTILTKDIYNDYLCTGHQSFVYIPEKDQCLIAYHRFFTPLYNYPTGLGFHRETCIENVTFNSTTDNINPITPTMYGVSSVDTSNFTIVLDKDNYTYTGSNITPEVVVKDENGNTISNTCYTVSYSNNKLASSQAQVKISFKNNYKGELTKLFTIVNEEESTTTPTTAPTTTTTQPVEESSTSQIIVPDTQPSTQQETPTTQTTTTTTTTTTAPAVVTTTQATPTGATKVGSEWIAPKQKNTKVNKLTKAKKSFKATWSKVTGVAGYQVQYATDKKFKKNKKTVTISKNKTTSTTVKKLKAKQKYYVRIRTYKNVKLNGKTVKVYSKWSSAKTVTTESSTSTNNSNNNVSKTVYITPTGKKYHYDNHCNGGSYKKSTLKEAKSRGLTACKKCVY